MPTIPTPFIGGSDGPRPQTDAEQEIAAPFFTPTERAEQAAAPAPDLEGEPPEAIPKEAPAEADLAEAEPVSTDIDRDRPAEDEEEVAEVAAEPGFEAEPAEPETVEDEPVVAAPEEIIPIQVVEADEISRAKTVALGTDEQVGETEAVAELTDAVEETAAESDFPDFLAGPDGAEEPAGSEPVEVAEVDAAIRLETDEELEAVARELQDGELGAWIRQLIEDLGPYAAETAVARAFAAGYLAASRDKDKKED